jgi:hypothetical protein
MFGRVGLNFSIYWNFAWPLQDDFSCYIFHFFQRTVSILKTVWPRSVSVQQKLLQTHSYWNSYCRKRSSHRFGTVDYHHHHHISVMELGHLLTRSGLTYPEVSSKVCHDSFCQLGNSVSLPWVNRWLFMFKCRYFTLDIVLFSSLQRLLWPISHLALLHSSHISAVNNSVDSL